MRAVIYARYSEGPRQTDQSIEGQVADCRAYAADHGLDVIGIYADRHISGKSTEGRDEFLKMMRDADRHLFDAVLVWKIDRFGRNREDIAVNKMRLRHAGVQLMYAKESLPEGPEGILLEALLEGMAEYYSEDLRQKINRGIRESAKKGKPAGGTVAMGYRRGQDGRLELDPEGAEIVREIFRMHIAGAKSAEIVQMTYDRGVRSRTGGRMSAGTLHRILRNEHYCSGVYVVQGIEVPVPQIISRETFEAAAKHFKTSRHNGAGSATVEYLLSCKCYCEKCGKMLRGVSANGGGGKYYYYKCPGKDVKPITKDVLEELVIQRTVEDVLTDDMIEILADKVMEVQKAERGQDPAEQLKKDLASARSKQKNLIEAIMAGGGVSLVEKLNEVEARIDEISVEIDRAQLQRPIIPKEMVRGWLQSFRTGDTTDPAVRRRILQTFVAEVIVGEDEITIAYNTTAKEPQSVRLRPDNWSYRNGGRTGIRVTSGYILITVTRPA